jgi:hypothetical protein
MRRNWKQILDHAREVVESYEQRITLRQLYYRLVADSTLENTTCSVAIAIAQPPPDHRR